MKKTPIRISGLSLVAVALTLLTSCNDDNLFQLTGDMSALAFATAVPAASTDAAAASAPTVYHVMDAIEVEGDSLYLVYTVSDLDTIATQPTGSRGTPVDGTNLYSVCGSLNVSAFLGGDITKPLKETDEYGVTLTNAGSFINIAYGPSMDGTSQETYDGDPVWQLDGGIDNYYWPKNNSLAFYAYATATASTTWSGLTTDNFKSSSKIVFDYTVPTGKTNALSQRVDAEHQPDILVTSTLPMPRSSSSIKDYTKGSDKFALVPLTFYHPLCQVSFKANPSTSNKLKTDIVLNTITLSKLKGSGTCTFNPAATGTKSADKVTWDFTGVTGTASYTQTYDYDNKDGIVGDTIGTDAQHFMLIPQSLGGPSTGATVGDSPEATVSIGYTTSKGTKKTASFDLHKKKATTAFEWMAGRHYTYVLTGDLTSLTLDGSLLSWDTNQSALGLRHYVLKASKNELTFDDVESAQQHTFDILSYYYSGDTDDGTDRTPVACTIEYMNAAGNWQELDLSNLSSSSVPFLGTADDTGTPASFNSLSHLQDATLPTELAPASGTGMTFALNTDRKTNSSIHENASLSEFVFANDATVADGWDLSYCSVGGEYSASNNRNTANCYIVKHPGSYKFPLVYGNAIKNGNANASAYSTTVTVMSGGYTGAVLQNFVNFAGLKVQNTNQFNDDGTVKTKTDKGQTVEVLDDNKNPGYILPNIKNMNMASIGQTGTDAFKKSKIIAGAEKDLGGGVKIYEYTYLKTKLLWQDEAGMISNVKLVGVKDHPESASISFETADASTLKQCNALIGLYVDADKDDVLDDGEPVIWSWHIWVTDADLSTSDVRTITNTSTANSYGISSSGTYKLMPRDLGECDMAGAYSVQLKTDYQWLDGMQLRIRQVEGDARPQLITIHQPGVEKHPYPNATVYQWGRKDPFTGKNLETNSDKLMYPEGSNTPLSTTLPTITGTPGNDAQRKAEIAETIKKPTAFYLQSTAASTTSFYLYYNMWNSDMNNSMAFNSTSVTFPYPSTYHKTIYDPCPYGYRVPDTRAFLAFDPDNTWTVASNSIEYGSSIMAEAKNSYSDAYCLLDANGAEDYGLTFPDYHMRHTDYAGKLVYSTSTRQTSNLSGHVSNISIRFVQTVGASFMHQTPARNGFAIRPILE